MSHNTIEVETTGGVTRIALNRPDSLNSFNEEMHAEVRVAIAAAANGTRAIT